MCDTGVVDFHVVGLVCNVWSVGGEQVAQHTQAVEHGTLHSLHVRSLLHKCRQLCVEEVVDALLLYYWCVVDDVEDSVCSGYLRLFTLAHSQA